MNERNVLLVAFLMLVGLSVFSYYTTYSGRYVGGVQSCKYLGGESNTIFDQQIISYDSDVNDRVPPQFLVSRCATGTTLSAVKCISGFTAERYIVQCPTGYICFESGKGAFCKKGNLPEIESNCVDTDGGKDSYTKGVVTIAGGRGKNIPEVSVDICATDTTVLETSCAEGGNLIRKEILQCPYPYKCIDGACRKS